MWVFCENATGPVEANDADRRDPDTSKGGAVPFWGAVSDFVLHDCPKSVAAFRSSGLTRSEESSPLSNAGSKR